MSRHDSLATLHDLKKWYAHSFEKIGWLVLARHEQNTDRLESYYRSLERLRVDLKRALKSYEGHDLLADLSKMLHNLEVLQDFVHTTLVVSPPSPFSASYRRRHL